MPRVQDSRVPVRVPPLTRPLDVRGLLTVTGPVRPGTTVTEPGTPTVPGALRHV